MIHFFRYLLILAAFILPVFFLYKDENQFFILIGLVFGVTLAFWISHIFIQRRIRKGEKKNNSNS